MELTPDERQQLAAHLLAGGDDTGEPVEEVAEAVAGAVGDAVGETAAVVAAVVADNATTSAPEDAAIADAIRIQDQADADVQRIEAETDAQLRLQGAASTAHLDEITAAGEVATEVAGIEADALADLAETDTDPEPSHRWFRAFGS